MVYLLNKQGYFSQVLEQSLNLGQKEGRLLFYGEQGVGKKTLAKLVHENLHRSNLTFIDCSKNEEELEGILFGYRDELGHYHRGILESNSGGSLVFLHLDQLSETFQKKLSDIFDRLEDYGLNLLMMAIIDIESGRSVAPLKMEKRLIHFFQNQTLFIQPLKKRPQECYELIDFFFQEACRDFGKNLTLPEDIREKLAQKNYRNNITELYQTIRDLVQKADYEITLNHLVTVAPKRASEEVVGELDLMTIREAEIILIQKALIYTGENRTKAAKILGVSIRTLRNKINQYRQTGIEYFMNLR